MTEPLVDRVVAAIRRQPAITALTLVGSRRDNTAGPLSDWDFVIDSTDPQRVFEELPGLVSTFEPVAAFWDPLGQRRNYMATFPGLVKFDLHIDLPPLPYRPWQINRDTLAGLDDHFWDWTLWLAGKTLHGQASLVADELVKMHTYLLGPLGCEQPPRTLSEAVAAYLAARSEAEDEWGVLRSSSGLQQEVLAALRRYKLVSN